MAGAELTMAVEQASDQPKDLQSISLTLYTYDKLCLSHPSYVNSQSQCEFICFLSFQWFLRPQEHLACLSFTSNQIDV